LIVARSIAWWRSDIRVVQVPLAHISNTMVLINGH
jgi:hypothetical protein